MNKEPTQPETSEELSKVPNTKYQKLFEQFQEIDALPIDQWKQPHILGYICKKFKETFGVEYVFKFNTPLPSKSFELWQVKALSGKLSSRPEILKAYIDWAYAEKAKTAKRKPTSISFLTQDEYTNQYKWKVLAAYQPAQPVVTKLSRVTPLPPEYLQVCQEYQWLTIKTYGDLSFLYHSIESNEIIENRRLTTLAAVSEKGLDITLLDTIV